MHCNGSDNIWISGSFEQAQGLFQYPRSVEENFGDFQNFRPKIIPKSCFFTKISENLAKIVIFLRSKFQNFAQGFRITYRRISVSLARIPWLCRLKKNLENNYFGYYWLFSEMRGKFWYIDPSKSNFWSKLDANAELDSAKIWFFFF